MQPFEIDWLSIKPDESHRLASDHKIAICGALSIIFGFILVGINGEFEDLEIGLVVVGAVLLLLGAPMSLSSRYVMWFDSQNTFVVYFSSIFGKSSSFIELVYEVQGGDTVKIEHEVRQYSKERTDVDGNNSTETVIEHTYSMLIERKDGSVVVSPQGDILTSKREINMMRMNEIFSSKQIE